MSSPPSFSHRALRRYSREHSPAALRAYLESNLVPAVRSLALEHHTGEYTVCVALAAALGLDAADLHGWYVDAAWNLPPISYSRIG